MKGQNSNKILPIKSLLENLKNQSKKHYLHLDNKNNQPITPQLSSTPRVKQHYNPPQTHRPHCNQQAPSQQQQILHQKRSSLGKNVQKKQVGYHVREEMIGYPGYSSAKKDRSNLQFAARYVGASQQSFSNKIDYLGERFYMPNKSEQTYFTMKQQSKKNPELYQKGLDNDGKESLTLTDKLNSKFEEQTRYMSKFEKLESQPIFKDEITKIKTQLFHKEALLFEKTQQLEEKQRKVNQLKKIIESSNIQNNQEKFNLKENELKQANSRLIKRSQSIQSQLRNAHKLNSELQQIIKRQKDIIEELKNEVMEKQEQFKRYSEQNETNYKLFNLKVRQYEAEDRQKNHQIHEIKQKQRKHHENQQKMINGLNELLRQKQQILQQVHSIAANKQKEIDALRNTVKNDSSGIFKQLEDKQAFIRQLSAEVGDLKVNMRNLQLRITQMIEEQQQLKKNLSQKEKESTIYKNHLDNIVKNLQLKLASVNQEKADVSERLLIKINECQILQKTIENHQSEENKQICQLKADKNDLLLLFNNKVKELEEKNEICIKIQKGYEQLISSLKKQILELSQNMKKRQSSLVIIQQKNNQLQEKIRKYQSTPSRLTPPKNMPVPTAKLIKENERLNSIIKGMDMRLHQNVKLNSSLNEQIIIKQLQILNNNLSKKFKDDPVC